MGKVKRGIAVFMLATIFALSIPLNTLAKDETILGVEFVKNAQIAFSVPLYVFTVGVSEDEDLLVPGGYEITNLGTTFSHSNIGVTGVAIEGMAEDTSPFTVITTGIPTTSNQIQLSVGGINLGGTGNFDMRKSANAKLDLVLTGSIFEEAGGVKVIPTGNTGNKLTVPISGKITKEVRTDATAQRIFKMNYTISPIAATGVPVGLPYAGDTNPFTTP